MTVTDEIFEPVRERTQSPTTSNHALKTSAFGEISGVRTSQEQWMSLTLGKRLPDGGVSLPELLLG